MALRDCFPLSETHFLSAADSLSTDCNLQNPIDIESDEPASYVSENHADSDVPLALPATQNQALKMEKARQQLLELLLLNPQGQKLLREFLSTATGEMPDDTIWEQDETDDNIVQDIHFVQPANTPIDRFACQEMPTPIALIKQPCCPNPFAVHFYPAQLLRIAEQVQAMPCDELGYKTKLVACRSNLQAIRQQMISSNTGLVAFVAYKHKTSSLSFDDLMQEGIVGLIKAVDRFDPNRGIRFSTYAIFWIKQAISRLIVKQEKMVRLPVALAEKASIVFEAMRSYYLEYNRWPSLPELQGRCDLSLEEIKTISSYYQATHSLDASLTDENDDHTLMASLKQHQFALPLNELIANNLRLYLSKVVASLPEKEASILNMRFGLKNHTEMTLQAVADQLHVTRERVRQIQNKALKKIKQQFGYDLMPFLEPNDN